MRLCTIVALQLLCKVLWGTPTPTAGALIVIELSAPTSRSRAVGFHLGELELLILRWTIYFLQCLLRLLLFEGHICSIRVMKQIFQK